MTAPRTPDLLTAVDRLIGLPFPADDQRPAWRGLWGGPTYLMTVLHESRDFWEDRSEDVVEAAQRELDAACDALAAALTARWGSPRPLDLRPDPGFGEGGPDADDPVPEPFESLRRVASHVQVWGIAASHRSLVLTIGQADAEFPLQLLAAVVTEPVPAS
ncbi:hypothetical protein ACPA54_31840 [Uniformispora flossi]|uniref:hypothetical protein n=1 Tax=Uniformispora flossi TaxID=3390723 RepID=UPI003C2F4D25